MALRNVRPAELARRLGTKDATISDWFKRGTAPSAELMLKLPAALDINGHWLLTGEGVPDPMSPSDAARLLEKMRGLLLRRLDEEGPEGTTGGSSPPDAGPPKE